MKEAIKQHKDKPAPKGYVCVGTGGHPSITDTLSIRSSQLYRWYPVDDDITQGWDGTSKTLLYYIKQELWNKIFKEKKLMTYIEAQKTMVEFLNLKVGDTIKILRAAKNQENGWELNWHSSKMDDDVGKEFKISKIHPYEGIEYKPNYYVPFFVIEKIKDAPVSATIKISNEYDAVISEGVTKVGCQTIPFSLLEEIYNTAKKQLS